MLKYIKMNQKKTGKNGKRKYKGNIQIMIKAILMSHKVDFRQK